MEEAEKFYPIAWKHAESTVITIPSNICKGLNIKKGDRVKVWLRKHYENNKDKND